MMKHLFLLLLVVGLLFLAGCGNNEAVPGEEEWDDIPLPPEPQPPGELDGMEGVLTVAECTALQGTAVNIVGGYDCEQGEMAIGTIEELAGEHVCCVA